ncbi:MAG: SDR family oxidoreductase [Planctomycetes bacterium]|nr:SDR family oxidoreductase [Planctomycetota bacterium]
MMQISPDQRAIVAVTGATGYVGGRLVPRLLDAGYRVRCLVREPRKLAERPWRTHPDVTVECVDLVNGPLLTELLRGCSAAYYLVHSMESSGKAYAEHDRALAGTFGKAAATAGVGRLIYLGGLGELGAGLSEHLSSRREVERVLAESGVPLTVFRAAMIIGSGSASFEILRYLVERLPVMVTPAWVRTESQPVAITDVLHWLVRCLAVPQTSGATLEIGGPDVLPYRELMQVMAQELGLPPRVIMPLPVLTPRLSSGWISLVTPVSYRIARPLAEGLRNRVVVTNDLAQRLMPHAALGVRDSIHRALERVRSNDVNTRWSAAGAVQGDPKWAGGTMFTDQRSIEISASAAAVFRAVCRIGGGHGWYAGDILWRIRGWMDTLVGGPGLRRGRRDTERVEFGEALDFWRVIGVEHDRSLSLLAEMKLPGIAKLNFEMASGTNGTTTLTMMARFWPRGLLGILYWYSVLPLHNIVFGGMLRGIKRAAESGQGLVIAK